MRWSWIVPCLALMLVGACSKEPGGAAGTGGSSQSGTGGHGTSAPLDCVLADGLCAQDADCCVAPCLGGFCFYVPDGSPGTGTEQCRNSSACIDGACAPVSCRNRGWPCNGTGCCDGLECVDQHCVPETCSTQGQDCFPACCVGLSCRNAVCSSACGLTAAACTEDTECCDGYYCREGACTAICSYDSCGVAPDGQMIECCALACSDGGLCQGCNAASCTSDAECCDGAPCIDGTCGCLEEGGACGQSGACCDGLCKDGSCACVPKGEACTFGKECCGEVPCWEGVCQLDSCLGNLAACNHPTDCCDGVCTDGVCCAASGAACPVLSAGCCDPSESCMGVPPTCRSECVPPGELGCRNDEHCCESSCDWERQRCRPTLGQDCSMVDFCDASLACGRDQLCCRDRSQPCAADPESCCDDMVCGDQGTCCVPDGLPCIMDQGCCGRCENGLCGPLD